MTTDDKRPLGRGLMAYHSYIRRRPQNLQEATEALERLARALYTPEDADALASIIQALQDNHEAAAYLLGRMLDQDFSTLRS